MVPASQFEFGLQCQYGFELPCHPESGLPCHTGFEFPESGFFQEVVVPLSEYSRD